jgi:hypothetical protein
MITALLSATITYSSVSRSSGTDKEKGPGEEAAILFHQIKEEWVGKCDHRAAVANDEDLT